MSKSQLKKYLPIVKTYGAELKKRNIAVKHLYLFGSIARGMQRHHSDIDIAVVVAHRGNTKQYIEKKMELWKAVSAVDTRIEPVLIDTAEIKNPSTTIGQEIVEHGIRVL